MSTRLNIIILAAGKGTRMRSSKPKVLHQIANKSLLEHCYDTASSIENTFIQIVYGHGGQQVIENLSHIKANWVEQKQQLGTGHAVRQAVAGIRDDDCVVILYGDVPLLQSQSIQALAELVSISSMGLLTVNLGDPTGYGRIIRDENGVVQQIVEEKDATAQQRLIKEVNTGILSILGKNLKQFLAQLNTNNSQGEYYLTDVIEMAVKQGIEVKTNQPQAKEEVLGVNDKVQLSHLERHFQKQQSNELMKQGVKLFDPNRFDLRGKLEFAEDVCIDINVILEGNVILGAGVEVGPNCIIKNSKIGPGTCILANSIIEDSQVGENCRIGPFARIRPDTKLAQQVNIGNFVEIKKSTINSGSKVNHLSYIGDTTMGKKVNIGAGTITCNYDGANKYRTTIGDDVFVGSGTQLVAPVIVNTGTTIGAGSTITRDTPEYQLTLARAKQISIKRWQRPKKK